MSEDDAKERLKIAATNSVPSVKAMTFVKGWASFSKPRAVSCDDGNAYVIKGRHLGKPTVTDQVVARVGFALGAPVPEPMLVNVSHFTEVQNQVRDHLSEMLRRIQEDVRNYAGLPPAQALKNSGLKALHDTYISQYLDDISEIK